MAYLGKSPSLGVRNRYYFTASGGETSISGALTGGTLTFSDGAYVDVMLNGVTLVAGTDYNTTTANTIAGLTALVASDVVEIIVYDVFSVFGGNMAADLKFGDNVKSIYGAGSDLQIYHDGTDSHINVTGALTVDVSGDINLDAGGGEIYFQDDGATIAYLSNSNTDLLLGVQTQDKDLYIQGNDGGSTINALQLDMSAAGLATFNAGASFSGNVGIGTASPSSFYTLANNLVVGTGSGGNGMTVFSGSSDSGYIGFNDTASNSMQGFIQYNHNGDYMAFAPNGSEKMRIQSDGGWSVGQAVGTALGGNGSENVTGIMHYNNTADSYTVIQSNGSNAPLYVARTANASGTGLIRFGGSGSNVGAIGDVSGRIFFADAVQNTGISFYQACLLPTNINGTAVDNTYDCGHPSYRWDDIRATNGTIQTSDQNEKQQIAILTNAEMTAAKSISTLFKTFKWNSAVEAKGDAARTHAGVIAQDVQAAMTAAGLDAGDYAFFISNTWWETQTEVPAVEADEENGIEAVAAHTSTDIYDTAEEAPEGATKRTRMGIRYPELLSFVGAATEQRLTNVEARITALEAE